MKTTTTLLAALFATALSGAALAEEAAKSEEEGSMSEESSMTEEGGMVEFSAVDGNGDGVITPDEAEAVPQVKEQWAALDANADGQVDESEFANLKGQS